MTTSSTSASTAVTRPLDVDPLVRLRGIEKSFDHGAGRFHVLRRIDLDVRPAEFVSVMGPSGAGKSTLLHLLGLQDSEWTGEYVFAGVPVGPMDPKARARLRNENIGFVFQSYHLLDELTVAENLDVPLSYRDVKRPQRESLVAEALDRLASRHARGSTRASSPAGSSSWWGSPARSSPSRGCCSPTSRPAICTRSRRARSCSSSASSTPPA